ncbi:hypothetical protein C4J81_18550 [Deltaproteobacteria bacterium Smac51]|nr:hypothetical protein C4J81_18550 [Deltaproteobacteria bacterium Smac51]
MIEIETPCRGKKLSARAHFSGEDLWVLVSGGDLEHIGSVSLAVPRASLTGDGTDRATVSTLNATGHKDDHIGNRFASALCSAFRCRVSVSCGIHFENLDQGGIAEVVSIAMKLLVELENGLDDLRREIKN